MLPQIYAEETGETLDWVQDDASVFGTLEESLLTEVCQARGVSPPLVKQLLNTEQAYYGMRRRHQIYHKIDALFKRDWRSNEEILADLADDDGASN